MVHLGTIHIQHTNDSHESNRLGWINAGQGKKNTSLEFGGGGRERIGNYESFVELTRQSIPITRSAIRFGFIKILRWKGGTGVGTGAGSLRNCCSAALSERPKAGRTPGGSKSRDADLEEAGESIAWPKVTQDILKLGDESCGVCVFWVAMCCEN